jgi:two-component system chemotaxis response regulator CheB
MPVRDVVVIGASSGGVEALSTVVAGLPADLAAAVFIVLHVGESRESHLPTILNRVGSMPVAHAVDQEPIRRGRIYVAPPGLQMYVHSARLSVRRGPVENLHRPSIDALFRTAAHYHGARVVGVILSGALDDGAAGLAAIKAAGGVAIVQDPHEARVADMPMNALERTEVDYVIGTDEIPAMLRTLVGRDGESGLRAEVPLETVEEAAAPAEAHRSDELGPPSDITCPDCAGTLYEIKGNAGVRFRCRVGHAYSEETLVAAQEASVERALWTALRALEERGALLNKIADYARRRGHDTVAAMFVQKSQQLEDDVKALHEVVTNGRALDPIGHERV